MEEEKMPQLSLLEETALYWKDKINLICPTWKPLTGCIFCHNCFCDCLSSHLKCSVYLKTKALINHLICFIFASYIFHMIIYKRLWNVEKKKTGIIQSTLYDYGGIYTECSLFLTFKCYKNLCLK